MTWVVLELSENGEYPLFPLQMCHRGNMQGLQKRGGGGGGFALEGINELVSIAMTWVANT